MKSKLRIHAEAVAFLVSLAGCAAGHAGPDRVSNRIPAAHPREPLAAIYGRAPPFESAKDGAFATGVALTDFDGDGAPDLIVANGNDMSPQPLTLYLNHAATKSGASTPFSAYPDWYSDDIDYLGNVAVGDIDGDGWTDVAVSVPLDKSRHTQGGGIKIYMNHQGRLESLPSQRIAEGYGSFDCDLADMNGDGKLDLAVSAFNMPVPPPTQERRREPARVYLNEGGRLHPARDWTSEKPMFGFSVHAADVDQDGWMDLAFGGEDISLFRGSPPAPRFALKAAWQSESTAGVVFSIDSGRIGPGPHLALAATRTCVPGGPPCVSDVVLFRPDTARSESVWRSRTAHYASMLLLADVNDDGFLDLVASQWGEKVKGGPLWFFRGRAEGTFSREPDFETAGKGIAVGQGLAVADTRSRAVTDREYVWRSHQEPHGPVITLPERRVVSITSVRVAGREVPRNGWAFVPGENWISLAGGIASGVEVRITYRASPVHDLVEATWDSNRGNLFFASALPSRFAPEITDAGLARTLP
ncbi:VCBS repeat-containing protein [Pendulispora brunnea]|uniref:VCBS repeat-containing protein n=1 Tax=Pendulispora brunnea TaxID=2905690 RepID=A0ABZ2KC52_9BACT